MTEPLSLDTILGEFSEHDEAWVLQDEESLQFVIIPDSRFPGRRPVRFFMKQDDADAHLQQLLTVNERLRDKAIVSVKEKLKPAIRGIASDNNPANADAFVVHSPKEVYEYLRDRT